MHRPTFGITHFFIGHAKVHHNVYKGNNTYSVGDRDPNEVTFAWWAMPIIPIVHIPVMVGLYFLFGMPSSVAMFVASLLYQASYEYLHYCMHIAQGRWIEGQALFRWLNNHHLQHHRKHNTNLNVVIPIADYVFRTRRSCASPDAVTITQEVGYLPMHRRPSRLSWLKKARMETWWLAGYVWRQAFRRLRSAAV